METESVNAFYDSITRILNNLYPKWLSKVTEFFVWNEYTYSFLNMELSSLNLGFDIVKVTVLRVRTKVVF